MEVLLGTILLSFSTVIFGIRYDFRVLLFCFSAKHMDWRITSSSILLLGIIRFFWGNSEAAQVNLIVSIMLAIILPMIVKLIRDRMNDLAQLLVLVTVALIPSIVFTNHMILDKGLVLLISLFLPYVLSGAFLFLLVLVGVYFFSAQAYYTKAEIRDREWLQTEEEQLSISRQMQEYAQLTDRTAENKATFEAKQYPMAFVAKEIMAQVPISEQHVAIFNKNETNQITLVLEGLTVTEISETVEKFKALAYVSNVQLIRMENQVDGAGSTVELWLDLDEAALREEVLS